ncbi:DUF6355 family natural product biosynthesis protein [Nonomuraea sp. NPDC050404]|uniref:DUF6355 family natural product biosynthesis protein n=1 Tax=Nonomuraea sp. NPDC050404 TaxID=3155783 RepID=UPI0034052BC6
MRFTTPTITKSAIVAFAAATIAFAGTPASAATTTNTQAAAQLQCGYYKDEGGLSWYGHCDTPPRTDVVIHVDTIFAPDYERCVKPGATRLGYGIRGAWYTGKLCVAG